MWQIGNETSYPRTVFGTNDDAKRIEIAAKKTIEFAVAMRQVDPSIKLIGWGDSGWSRRMLEIAGEHLQYIAFHHMFNPDRVQQMRKTRRCRVSSTGRTQTEPGSI